MPTPSEEVEGARWIPLTKGEFTLVDEEDYDYLMQWKWHVKQNKDSENLKYAQAPGKKDGKDYTIRMHRLLLNCPDGLVVDHINGFALDNRKRNLRICTRTENQQNLAIHRTGRKRGVSPRYYIKATRYIAQRTVAGKTVYIGTYATEDEALKAFTQEENKEANI